MTLPWLSLRRAGKPEGGRSVSAAHPQPTEQAYIRHPIKSFDIRIIAILILIIYNRLDARCKLAPRVAGGVPLTLHPPLRLPGAAPVAPRGKSEKSPFNTFGIKEYNLIYII